MHGESGSSVFSLMGTVLRLAYISVSYMLYSREDDDSFDLDALKRNGSTLTGRIYAKTDDGCLVCVRQIRDTEELVKDWDAAYDSLECDVTETVLRFAGKDMDFNLTPITPSDMLLHESPITFKRHADGAEWLVPSDTPVLDVLRERS